MLDIEADVPVESGDVFRFIFDKTGGLVTAKMFNKFKGGKK